MNYFSHAAGVPKAIGNTWKFVMFIVLYLILYFARSSVYHHAHTIDMYDYLCYGYLVVNAALLRNRHRKGPK